MYYAIVRFTKIFVHSAGDADGYGDIFYELKVNNVVVDSRNRDERIHIKSFNSIEINKEIELALSGPDEYFDISGTISEDDTFINDKVRFSRPTKIDWTKSPGDIQADEVMLSDSERPIGDGVLSVSVSWTISGHKTSDFGQTDNPSRNTDARLPGVVVYVDWKLNRERIPTTPSAPFTFGHSPFQMFRIGAYNLPSPVFGSIANNPVYAPGIAPDSISSIKVGTGFYVELFRQKDFGGTPLTLFETTEILPEAWNDATKSLRVLATLPR